MAIDLRDLDGSNGFGLDGIEARDLGGYAVAAADEVVVVSVVSAAPPPAGLPLILSGLGGRSLLRPGRRA